MVLTYKQWLQQTGRKPTAANADLWKRTVQAPQLRDRPTPPPAPPAASPLAWTAGLSDEEFAGAMGGDPAVQSYHDARGTTPPTPAAASAPAPPPLPTDPNREAAIQAIINRLAALPGIYNTQRKDLAANTVAGLVEGGLLDSASFAEQPGEGGNITYKLVVGPNGRLYRQAFTGARDSFNAHGLLNSSFMRRAQADSQRDLDTRLAQATRGYDQASRGITDAQRQETQGLEGDLTRGRTEYGDWQRGQPAPFSATQALAQPVNTTAPDTGGGPQPYQKPTAPKPVAPKPKPKPKSISTPNRLPGIGRRNIL